jgi:hypothetical protein
MASLVAFKLLYSLDIFEIDGIFQKIAGVG